MPNLSFGEDLLKINFMSRCDFASNDVDGNRFGKCEFVAERVKCGRQWSGAICWNQLMHKLNDLSLLKIRIHILRFRFRITGKISLLPDFTANIIISFPLTFISTHEIGTPVHSADNPHNYRWIICITAIEISENEPFFRFLGPIVSQTHSRYLTSDCYQFVNLLHVC